MSYISLGIMLLQVSGIVVAPIMLLNIVRGMLKQEGMYDRESRNIMFMANSIGIVLGVAWFFWSASYIFRLCAGLFS